MPNFPGSFNLSSQLRKSRPKVLSSMFQGTKKGIIPGALAGLAVGGPAGAAVGAGLGVIFGTLTVASKKLVKDFGDLDKTTRSIVDHYKNLDPIMARINHQIRMTDRRINRMWARTIAPLTKRLSDISRDFQMRWEKMKVALFDSMEPYLNRITDILKGAGRVLLWALEGLTKAITSVIGGFTKLFRFLGILPEDKEGPGATQKLKPFDMDFPTMEGPLTGAMRRTALKGPPFTEEKRDEDQREREGKGTRSSRLTPPDDASIGTDGLGGLKEALQKVFDKKEKKQSDINVEVKVDNSKELSAAFESVWKEVAYKIRQVEAEDGLLAFQTQQEGTFV